jgi:adenylate cyclase
VSFLTELKRRKVLQTAVIYAVTAWIIVQIVATIKEPLNLPHWTDTLVIVLLAVGFPIALIMSWVYDIGARGLVPTPSAKVPVPGAAPESATDARSELLPNSIAVLPFENLSPNPDDAYFAAGMHEQLLNELARIRGLNVIARTSVLRYGKDPPPIPQIAAALNVETVMEGSVRYAGDKVRVTAQLIKGASGAHLWTENYDGDLSDIFKIQTDIATTIAGSLRAELLPETRAQIEKPPTDSPAAYALFLQANGSAFTERPQEAIALLDRALAIDPAFALAHASKGQTKAWMLINGFGPAVSEPKALRDLEQSAIADADRALAIDPNLGAAWYTRGLVNQLCWRWGSTDRDFAKALELSPNDPGVLSGAVLRLADKGDCSQALALARRLVRLNPNVTTSYTPMVMVGNICRHPEESLAAARKLRELAPGHAGMVAMEGHAQLSRGDFAAAASAYRTAEDLMTDATGHFLPAIIYAYGIMGRREDARRVFGRYKAWTEKYPAGAGGWQFAYLGIGEPETAYEWLTRNVEVVERGEPDAGYFAFLVLKKNAHDDPVLKQPRFKALFDRIDTIAQSR